MAYEQFAERLVATGVIPDPWVEGHPRFRETPLVFTPREVSDMYRAAESVAAAYNEVCLLCMKQPELLDDFLNLTPYQKLMWASTCPHWHGVARADVFRTAEGLKICEINSDTPTGEAEAIAVGRVAIDDQPRMIDPMEGFEERFCAMIEATALAALEPGFPRTIGVIYPTEMPEDLPLVKLYRQWFESRGWKVALGSPFNLTQGEEGRPALMGTSCSVLLRHYKTDWWGERWPVWDDEEPYPDDEPLTAQLALLINAMVERRCVVLNPLGAVVPQNKRAMALMWEHIDDLSPEVQQIVREYVPYTVRLEATHAAQLSAERELWVLKSDYGCEGAEVVVGKYTTQEIWDESLKLASRGRWVAQQYFQPIESESGESVNHGVYLIAGEASGLYVRAQKGPTDGYAESTAGLIDPAPAQAKEPTATSEATVVEESRSL